MKQNEPVHISTRANKRSGLFALNAMVWWIVCGGLACPGCGSQRSDPSGDITEKDSAEMKPLTLSGVVKYHDAGVAIGGETDPYGYILEGDHGFNRLYLSFKGSMDSDEFKSQLHKTVTVSGRLRYVEVGGVETPRRRFPVLEIAEASDIRRKD